MARLFGTDGVRGIAGSELGYDLACALGRAAVRKLGKRVLIGRDSRVSGPLLEQALVDGICHEGGEALVTGVIPTPAVAFLTRELGADCGIVISASHNPPEYNGIKFFDRQGYKLPDSTEDEMQLLVEEMQGQVVPGDCHAAVVEDAVERYVAHALDTVRGDGVDLRGLRIALDCGHGAAGATTPLALERLGAQVYAINTTPDGEKINVGCGSTHLEQVSALLDKEGCDIALAHDGDADRLLAVAPGGEVVDGDFILAICGLYLKEQGKLPDDTVVSTVMANLGFQLAMREAGINVLTVGVGDRYVLEKMRTTGAAIGGEQSGHVIFLEHSATGDGLVTALQLLRVMAATGKPLAQLMQVMKRYPQALVNVTVRDKALCDGDAVIAEALAQAQDELGDEGRVLVRPSGTEPLIRVMVEAKTTQRAEDIANSLAAVVSQRIGS